MQTFTAGAETPKHRTPALIFLYRSLLLRLFTYAPQGPELPPNHLAASCAPYNCSPRSALTWEDWLQAAACSSREQAWRRALGGNNFTLDPPLPRPRPQHELRTGFREREEKHRINQRRGTGTRGQGRAGGDKRRKGRGGRDSAERFRGGEKSESRLGRCCNFSTLKIWQYTMQIFRPHDGSQEL